MYASDLLLMIGDRVFYQGEKFKQELTRDGKPLVGWIHARVEGSARAYIVSFPETKRQDSYIMDINSLTKFRPADNEKYDGPIVEPRRMRSEEEDS
jgi:hypothetical protein